MSVLVPAFNHESYIADCLKSVHQSSYRRIELLITDDGSSDQTFEVARAWLDSYGARFERTELLWQKNRGVTPTLNGLVGQARGAYICALASDDLLLPDGISHRVNALEHHHSWLAVFGDCEVVDENGFLTMSSALKERSNAHLPALLREEFVSRELILRWSVPGPALLTRAEAYDPDIGVGLYDEALQVEDRDFYLRLLARHALGFVPQTVAKYRLHGANTIAESPMLVSRHVGVAERKNVTLFHGRERFYLRLVALKGEIWRRSVAPSGLSLAKTGYKVCAKSLGGLQRLLYYQHRASSAVHHGRGA